VTIAESSSVRNNSKTSRCPCLSLIGTLIRPSCFSNVNLTGSPSSDLTISRNSATVVSLVATTSPRTLLAFGADLYTKIPRIFTSGSGSSTSFGGSGSGIGAAGGGGTGTSTALGGVLDSIFFEPVALPSNPNLSFSEVSLTAGFGSETARGVVAEARGVASFVTFSDGFAGALRRGCAELSFVEPFGVKSPFASAEECRIMIELVGLGFVESFLRLLSLLELVSVGGCFPESFGTVTFFEVLILDFGSAKVIITGSLDKSGVNSATSIGTGGEDGSESFRKLGDWEWSIIVVEVVNTGLSCIDQEDGLIELQEFIFTPPPAIVKKCISRKQTCVESMLNE
jgi:hypothetical protein